MDLTHRDTQTTKFEFGPHQYGETVARGLNENTASSSQVRQSDVNSSSGAGKVAAETTTNPIGTRLFRHLEKVFSNVQQKFARQLGDDMPEIVVNAMIWGVLMSATSPRPRRPCRASCCPLFFPFVELSDTRPTRDSAASLRTLGHPTLVCAYCDGNRQHLLRKSHATHAQHNK